jgi:ABC-type transport system substrate-binding protein
MAVAACGGEEEPAPGPSAEEIATIVEEAVAKGPTGVTKAELEAEIATIVEEAVAKGPTGVTKAELEAEIAMIVEEAVAKGPTGVTKAELEAEIAMIVEEAVAKGPTGLTKAELEEAVSGQVKGLTAAEVKQIVASAIAGMPAPKVDASEIRPLVEQAVAAAAPKGTSAEEIGRLVEAAVTAATQGAPTRGELESAISRAVEEASAGQLTAAEVETIVNASVGQAAAMAAKEAVEAAVPLALRLPPVRAGFKRSVLPPRIIPDPDPMAELADEQVLRFSLFRKRNSVTPWNDPWQGLFINPTLFMPPFRYDPDGNLVQGLALAYDANQKASKFTIHLDPDAVFTDGTPVTAADLKLAWEIGAYPENQVSWGASLIHLKNVMGMDTVIEGDGLEASGLVPVDDHTLDISLIKSVPTFPFEMAIGMLGVFKADLDREDYIHHLIGAGPFSITFDPDTSYVQLDRAEHYWMEPATLERVEMTLVPDSQTQLIQYEAGETDVILASAGKQQEILDPEHPLYPNLRYVLGANGVYMHFYQGLEPMQDSKVRAAISHALDMEAMVKAVYGSTAERNVGVIPSSMRCFRGGTEYEFDVAKAQQLLAESTYGSGENVPTITAGTTSEKRDDILFYELMQEALKDNLGIKMDIITWERGAEGRSDDLSIRHNSHTWGVVDPSQPLYDEGHSNSPVIQGRAGYVDRELDALVDRANSLALDDPGRCKAFQDAEDHILDNYYLLPKRQINNAHAFLVQPWVANFAGAYFWEINTWDKIKILKK